jgi:nitrogen fixation protein FixH
MAQQIASSETMPRSLWRFFPFMVMGGLAVVVAVNITMAVLAHRSAPGLAVQGSFATSNAYGAIQAEAKRQVGLGWSLDVSQHGGRVAAKLAGQGGGALPGAVLVATAQRPVGEVAPLALAMVEDGAGGFRSDIVLPGQGQWDITFVAKHEGRTFRHTRRVIVQ